ncbi:MAG: InlB B-repeat-containing protein [Clostridia bacterium]|nr:InlB B-repeat-containing protein [Clostridia bacterium]
MKRKVLIAVMAIVCVISCALGLAACNFGNGDDGGNGGYKEKCAVYHFNGGYSGYNSEDTRDYRCYLPDTEDFTPLIAKRDTWVFENWYFDEALTEVYSDERFAELRAQKDEIDLYAKWVDEITVTKDNFTEYFLVSSRWNGGAMAGSGGNAGIYYSISPKMTFDPANSAESFEVEVTPVLTNNNVVVWSSETSVVTLTSEDDYSCSYLRKINSSAVGIQFNIAGRTLEYKLLTESFKMKLVHKVPIEITLDLDGDTDVLNATGSEKLLKDSLPEPEKSGYEFKGWYTDADYKTEYTDWVVNRPRTLYAKFVKKVVLTYHMNGAEAKESKSYLAGDYIYLGSDIPERDGYKFFGYYTTENFEDGTKFTSGYVGEDDIDLYARWEVLRTITFVTNGGEEKEPIKVADTEIPNLGNTPFKNYSAKFGGWYTDAEFTQEFDEKAPVSKDVTLYALWVEERSLYLSIEELQEYIDIQLVPDRTDGVLKLTLTISVKEKYRKYGLSFMASWSVDLEDDNGNSCGNGTFGSASSMSLSAPNGKLTATGVYTASKGTANNNATVFNLKVGSIWGYVNIPEGGFAEDAN